MSGLGSGRVRPTRWVIILTSVVLIIGALVLLPIALRGRGSSDPPPFDPPLAAPPPSAPAPEQPPGPEPAGEENATPSGEEAAPVPASDWNADSGGPPAPAPVPGPARSAGTPATAGLHIPSLGLRAPLLPASIVDQVFRVPRDPKALGVVHTGQTGRLADRLGAGGGTTLVSGHVTVGATRGALWPLHRLKPGAVLETDDGAGGHQRWQATSLRTVPADQLPSDLTDPRGRRRLVLVTCSGPVETHQGVRRYRDNLLVEAVPVR